MNIASRLDYQVIRTLAEMSGPGEPDFLSKIISMFLRSTPPLLESLKQSATDGDLRRVQKASHDLKSSSATLGAVALADLCADLESRVRAGIEQGTAALVCDIARELEAVQPELETLLAAREHVCLPQT